MRWPFVSRPCGAPGLLAVALMVPGLASADGSQLPGPLAAARQSHQAGDWDEALARYRAVIAVADDARHLGIAHNNACDVLIKLARPIEALEECGAALERRREAGERRGLARTLNNQGLALRHLGRYEEAELAYLEALALNEELGDFESQVLNRSNLGVVLEKRGRYGEAMSYYVSAEQLAHERTDGPWARYQWIVARNNQGTVLEKLGAFEEALELYRSLVFAQEDDQELWASIRLNQGVLYRNLGDPLRALTAFEEAAAIYESTGARAALGNAKLNLAMALHLNLQRRAEAAPLYLAALDLARRSGDRSEEIQAVYYLGRLSSDLGDLDAAEKWFRECVRLSEASDSIEGRWSGLHGLGNVAFERGHLDDALAVLGQAIGHIEEIRSSLSDSSWRTGFFGDKRPVYALAVRVLAALEKQRGGNTFAGQAFAIVQQAKMRELIDRLAGRQPAEPLAAAAASRLLETGEILLEYFDADGTLFLWIVDADGIRMVELGPAVEIFPWVEELRQALAGGHEPPRRAIDELSRQLVATAGIPAGTSRLRISPDGPLFYLPFELLSASGATLLESLAVSYLPSASTLAMLRRRTGAAAEPSPRDGLRLAGFANPELPEDSSQPLAPVNLLLSRHGLSRLPGAEAELEAVGRLLAGRQNLYFGPAATEDAFRRAASRGTQVMHLATHTVVDERPGRGAVVLLGAGDGHDGLLHPEEILELDYRARLTVLASCRSALGGLVDGQAMSSLTSSFLAAGSSAVLATLWDVDDGAAAVFMEQFYHQLRRGQGAAEALRRAKLKLSADPGWNRPGLWAAFVLVGEAPRLELGKFRLSGRAAAAALLAAAGLASLFLARRAMRSRRG